MAYRRLQQHVGAFRDFLRKQGGPTAEGQELVAAKLMGRWRSGAPLVLAPDKDDPALGADPARNNNFDYGTMDPHGYAIPLGSHIRRMNPRDTAHNMHRRRVIRRGGTYGPHLPEGAPDDGAERGLPPSSGARAWSVSSNSCRTCGSTTQSSMSLGTSATRSSAPRTAAMTSPSRSGPYGGRSSACRPSRP